MIDRAKIYVQAGDGGCGCNSFKGRRLTRAHQPDGGNGGRGADIIIRVDSNRRDLEYFRFNQHFRADNGRFGQANRKQGADGRPCVIKVPAGTVIRDLKSNLVLRDLIEPSEELVVARGGSGGRSNTSTKSATAGSPGEVSRLALELRLVADISIVGYPNTGKSTLLAQVSSALPKIAAYPFTTAAPFLGVINFADFEQPEVLTIVEIPALIKGSYQGKGLGAQFLRHSQRSKVLIHLIDMAAQEGREPLEDYQNVNQELKYYNPELLRKYQVLVANKMDLPDAEINLKKFSSRLKKKVYPISALSGKGIKELLNILRTHFRKG